jgi:hypothetical protein
MNDTFNQLLTDPSKLSERNKEIYATFELAKLSMEEKIVVMDKINNHALLTSGMEKLSPFIHKL